MLTPIRLLVIILVIAAPMFMAGRISVVIPPAPMIIPVITSAAEVSDLIDQLRIVARDSYSDYGTYVHFSLKSVKISVQSKNGDNHEVSAPTLRAAVKQLTAPDGTVSSALKEWETTHPGQQGN